MINNSILPQSKTSSSKRIYPLIFIVDDDNLYGASLRASLINKFNAEIRVFKKGEDCLDQLRLKPDIIILDQIFNNTHLQGLDVLRAIRRTNKKIPVLMLSGQNEIEIAVKSMLYGAYHYLEKENTLPYDLHNAIKEVLQ